MWKICMVMCFMLFGRMGQTAYYEPGMDCEELEDCLEETGQQAIPAYYIQTKRYERWPGKGHVSVKFAKITGDGSQRAYDAINYVLERDAFRVAGDYISSEIMKESDSVLQAISKIQDEEYLFVTYDVAYEDDSILCIEIRGDVMTYSSDGSVVGWGDCSLYDVFDVKTGKKLELSDFIEIDRRIVDWKAEDYQPTNYSSPVNECSYSFMDAFEVYEEEQSKFHEKMNVEEAIEALKEGEIHWAIRSDKALLLYWGWQCSFFDEAWIEIPYSDIEDIAYY